MMYGTVTKSCHVLNAGKKMRKTFTANTFRYISRYLQINVTFGNIFLCLAMKSLNTKETVINSGF